MTLRLVKQVPDVATVSISTMDDAELAAIAGTGLRQALSFGGQAHYEYGQYEIDVKRTDLHAGMDGFNCATSQWARLHCVVRQNGVVVVHRVWQVAEHQAALEQRYD
jgi:hypothetical protein